MKDHELVAAIRPTITHEDGFTIYRIPDEAFTTEETVEAKTGIITGQKRKFTISANSTQIEKGLSYTVLGSDGVTRNQKSLSIIDNRDDPQTASAKREAKALKNFFTNLRKWTGLNKGTREKPVTVRPRDIVDISMLHRWYDTREQQNPFTIHSYSYNGVVGDNEVNYGKYLKILKDLQAKLDRDAATKATKSPATIAEAMFNHNLASGTLTDEEIAEGRDFVARMKRTEQMAADRKANLAKAKAPIAAPSQEEIDRNHAIVRGEAGVEADIEAEAEAETLTEQAID